MKDKSAFEKGSSYVALVNSTLALCGSSFTMLGIDNIALKTFLVTFFLLCAIASLVFTLIGMVKEDDVCSGGMEVSIKDRPQSKFSLDISTQSSSINEDSKSDSKQNDGTPKVTQKSKKGQNNGSNK